LEKNAGTTDFYPKTGEMPAAVLKSPPFFRGEKTATVNRGYLREKKKKGCSPRKRGGEASISGK